MQSLSLLHLLGSCSQTIGLSLLLTTEGVRVGNLNLSVVLTLYSDSISLGGLDTGITHSLGLTNLTILVLLSHTNLGLVDSLGCSLLTESLDIARLILDVSYVHVDETQTYLLQLHLNVL